MLYKRNFAYDLGGYIEITDIEGFLCEIDYKTDCRHALIVLVSDTINIF